MKIHENKVCYSLLELNTSLKRLVRGINRRFWVYAEITQVQIGRHAYLELAQKNDEKIQASNRANIWENHLQDIQRKMQEGSLENLLCVGNKILAEVQISHHEIYGISLTISDLEERFTLGDLARKRQKTLQKLKESGLLFRQKSLSLPAVIQKIAVISSETAAGYSDFKHHLTQNRHGYAFLTTLFQSDVQGKNAVRQIIEAFAQIQRSQTPYQAIALIRGGGSRLDLEVFNDYALASCIAHTKIPVLTGIGHQTDQNIADEVAYRVFKTPTAVADFLVARTLNFETKLAELGQTIYRNAAQKITQQHNRIAQSRLRLKHLTNQALTSHKMHLQKTQMHISFQTQKNIRQQDFLLQKSAYKIERYATKEWEKMGLYRLAYNGKPLKPTQILTKGDVITLYLKHKKIRLIVD